MSILVIKKPRDLGYNDLDYEGEWIDISEEVEKTISSIALRMCSYFSISLCGHVDYDSACSQYMELVEPYTVKIVRDERHGYITTDFLCALNSASYELIDGIRFDSFVPPHFPENICYLYHHENKFLNSITHEGFYELFIELNDIYPYEKDLLLTEFLVVES